MRLSIGSIKPIQPYQLSRGLLISLVAHKRTYQKLFSRQYQLDSTDPTLDSESQKSKRSTQPRAVMHIILNRKERAHCGRDSLTILTFSPIQRNYESLSKNLYPSGLFLTLEPRRRRLSRVIHDVARAVDDREESLLSLSLSPPPHDSRVFYIQGMCIHTYIFMQIIFDSLI